MEELAARDAELAAADAFLAGVEGGYRLLALEGGAGYGKTALLEATVARARTLGFRVLRAQPAETEAEVGFAVLADILVELDDQALAELPDPRRLALAVALRRSPSGPTRGPAGRRSRRARGAAYPHARRAAPGRDRRPPVVRRPVCPGARVRAPPARRRTARARSHDPDGHANVGRPAGVARPHRARHRRPAARARIREPRARAGAQPPASDAAAPAHGLRREPAFRARGRGLARRAAGAARRGTSRAAHRLGGTRNASRPAAVDNARAAARRSRARPTHDRGA